MATALSTQVARQRALRERKSEKRDVFREYPCDLCGAKETIEVPHAREYTRDEPIHICTGCGFVYVKRRRSTERIAQVWSEEIFGADYTAAIPAVRGRLTFVAEFIKTTVGLKGKTVCDIGAGEGLFLEMIKEKAYGAKPFGIEASPANCKRMQQAGIDCFNGTIEAFQASPQAKQRRFDVATIMWTMENCRSCRDMLDAAYRIVKPGGHLAIATGSRLLVPFKKPLYDYLSKNPADTHCFRFSANTLRGLLTESKFEVIQVNRFLDSDVLCMIAKRTDGRRPIPWQGDNYLDVWNFFERWHVETQMHFPRQVKGSTG